jgi:hypothetical protein
MHRAFSQVCNHTACICSMLFLFRVYGMVLRFCHVHESCMYLKNTCAVVFASASVGVEWQAIVFQDAWQ